MPPRYPVMGVRVTASDIIGIQQALAEMAENGRSGYVSCANAYSIGLANEDANFRDLLNRAAIVTADGVPVVWALRLFGYDSKRVHNDDLMLDCCANMSTWRHFLVGGRTGQPEQVATALRQRFPGIQIAGQWPTPVRPVPERETELILQAIKDSRANIVWAGLGTPQQDYWMAAVASRLNLPLVGCGSLFDLLSGRTRPAPSWMKRSGLQWLHRLIQEPRRLAYRYAWYNSKFLLGVLRQYLRNDTRSGSYK